MNSREVSYQVLMDKQRPDRPEPIERRVNGDDVSLNDKWDRTGGPVLMNGLQVIVRVLLAQAMLDRAANRNTAGYVSGYRGSPLGGLDMALWSVRSRLEAAGIRFQPGVNEELAATAIRGTQQVGLLPDPAYDGVFAAWYGKGPGVDRAMDAIKHGAVAGVSPLGGVLLFYGDDHAGKSSTVSHQSEQAMASCLVPSLYPTDAAEILRFGLLGYALSRFSGAWVGIKCVNETVEQTQTVELELDGFATIEPQAPLPPPEGVHIRMGAFNPLRDEQILLEHRLARVHAFVRANGIDREVFRAARPKLGIVTAGKSYGDVREALALLGLDETGAAALGVSLYKVGCIWPLEPQGLADFASGHEALLVIEEKKSFLEEQSASILVNQRSGPSLYGKFDEHRLALISASRLLEPADIAEAIVGRLHHLGVEGLLSLNVVGGEPRRTPDVTQARRSPYFCSGCPHSRSTRVPTGSLSMTGIGCHTMANLTRPQEALPPTQMGGEGASWLGAAPFTKTAHMFQNMGDGTYYHSGLLAIRAAVAAKVNITYKILYNDAVAMTGGQPIDGPISVAEIVRQVRDEGVVSVVVISDAPKRHAGSGLPSGVQVLHRDLLDEVQRRLRQTPGVTVLVYEQTCAAEKRRRRKRGLYPDPPKRLFIAKAVCEGCGDCSVQSTCVSIQPVQTAFGVKRRIDQSSCNKDYSCANGFCPSFITVRNAEPRKPLGTEISDELFKNLPPPVLAEGESVNLMIAGIGGTGVVTAAALISMAAHLDGKAASAFDMTGLAQKNGAVYSHVRVAPRGVAIPTQRIGRGQADVLLAFDVVAALGDEAAPTLAAGVTQAVVNTDLVSTVAFQFNRDFALDDALMFGRLGAKVDRDAVVQVAASALAADLLGDSMMTTSLLLGVATQRGLLPVRPASLEAAIRLNGVAVALNLRAFRLGRLQVHDASVVTALVGRGEPDEEIVPETLNAIVEHRSAHLTRYQDGRLAERYRSLVTQVATAEATVSASEPLLAIAVARHYAKLLAYKDEYEVARMLTDPALYVEIAQTFGDGAKLSFNMAPPALGGRLVNGRPPKREVPVAFRPLLRVLAKAKRLRGTRADPFGYTRHRRMERALGEEYHALVRRTLGRLTTGNLAEAAAVLNLAGEIRGYGPVKDEAVANYRRKLATLESLMSASPNTHSEESRVFGAESRDQTST
jgi:indolepyruvate ferredoxin oxidoreductase